MSQIPPDYRKNESEKMRLEYLQENRIMIPVSIMRLTRYFSDNMDTIMSDGKSLHKLRDIEHSVMFVCLDLDLLRAYMSIDLRLREILTVQGTISEQILRNEEKIQEISSKMSEGNQDPLAAAEIRRLKAHNDSLRNSLAETSGNVGLFSLANTFFDRFRFESGNRAFLAHMTGDQNDSR